VDDTEGAPDGMKLDARGNLWTTGPGGIWVLDPSGEPLGVVEIPEIPSNLNWAGSDWQILYITACTSLYRLRTQVAGNKLSYMG
jgi:sugar lactone lactonase YvrE